jgi:alpha-galactosidase
MILDNDIKKCKEWIHQSLLTGEKVPFSFVLDGKHSDYWLAKAERKITSVLLDKDRLQHKIEYGLSDDICVECTAIEYLHFPLVEWTVYMENQGNQDSPIIRNIRAMDLNIAEQPDCKMILQHQRGSQHAINDFEIFRETLVPGENKIIATSGGRPSNKSLPYFRIELFNRGINFTIGWPGQWSSQFDRNAEGLQIRAGQEKTSFKLLPGERIRTPLIALQFWEGKPDRAQNIFRRWMNQFNVPRPQWEEIKPFLTACSSHQFSEMEKANEANQQQFIDRYLEEGIPLNYWWMDAGWYVQNGSWVNTGTWEVDKQRFPNSLRAITDHGHAKRVGSIVWFEPERVTADSSLAKEHPEWLLTPPVDTSQDNIRQDWLLFDLGNEEARQWWTDWVVRFIEEEGIDVYRQDFNVDPLLFWRKNDAVDRQGITEIRYVQGLLRFFDELRERTGGILIDTCASGGRRLDLESMRRAVSLTRSDYHFEPVGQQSQTHALSLWLTFHGSGIRHSDAYRFRSGMAPVNILCYDMQETNLDYSAIRSGVEERHELIKYYDKDYYPLTPYSIEETVWMAWQFDSPETGDGIVMAFRRAHCDEAERNLKLSGLQPGAYYLLSISTSNEPAEVRYNGKDLLESGLNLVSKMTSDSILVRYYREI